MIPKFCPDLQLSWSIEKIELASLNCIEISLVELLAEPILSPIQRHGLDVLSYPSILNLQKRVKFTFEGCLYFNVRDFSAPGYSSQEQGEGKSFQRLLESELIRLHAVHGACNLFHYRIVCESEVIDIVSSCAPIILKL